MSLLLYLLALLVALVLVNVLLLRQISREKRVEALTRARKSEGSGGGDPPHSAPPDRARTGG